MASPDPAAQRTKVGLVKPVPSNVLNIPLSQDRMVASAFASASNQLIPHSGAMAGLDGRPATAQEVDLEDLFSLRKARPAVTVPAGVPGPHFTAACSPRTL
jgi:hypothetical protein